VPMVRALTQSLNLATVNLGLEVGLDHVARTFEQLGLDERARVRFDAAGART